MSEITNTDDELIHLLIEYIQHNATLRETRDALLAWRESYAMKTSLNTCKFFMNKAERYYIPYVVVEDYAKELRSQLSSADTKETE